MYVVLYIIYLDEICIFLIYLSVYVYQISKYLVCMYIIYQIAVQIITIACSGIILIKQ